MGELVAFPKVCAHCGYAIRTHIPGQQQISILHQGQHYHAACYLHVTGGKAS